MYLAETEREREREIAKRGLRGVRESKMSARKREKRSAKKRARKREEEESRETHSTVCHSHISVDMPQCQQTVSTSAELKAKLERARKRE
ncbi:hypothetical protein QQF64_016000 [Cirrhinus molitorella]|uniref:Uncharacterized protein n=1 Tax=Cirrhinus molitorella TaxID=172907 RepID=A0ABR3LNY2_9TELE